MKDLNRDVAQVGPLFVRGKTSAAFSLDKNTPAVKFKAVSDGNDVLAVLVNSSARRQEAKLIWQAPATAGTLSAAGRKIDIKNGRATVPLEPFAVEIVRWARALHG